MKKLFLVLLAIFLAMGICWAGAATSTATEFGYVVTGDTGAVQVSSARMWIKAVGFTPASSSSTAILYDNTTGVSMYQFNMSVAPSVGVAYFGESGVQVNNLYVKLSSASDIVYIYTRQN